MNATLHHLRHSSIVLAAIVGMFSAVGEASASAPQADAPGRACCVGRMCAGCCCPTVRKVSVPATSGRLAIVSSALPRLAPPAPLCECRPSSPDAPASRHEPRPPETREDQAFGPAIGPTVVSDPATELARIDASPPSSARIPVYLLTSRLLF
jgi:hypothetical protein